MRQKLAYHGSPHAGRILREGLLSSKASCSCGCIWLARKPEDASAFGNVIEVDMMGLPGDFPEGEWQARWTGGDIEPERLTLFRLV